MHLGTGGDLDGDGLHDLVVAAPRPPSSGNNSPGKVYVYLDHSEGTVPGTDHDGDGVGDLMIGAPDANNGDPDADADLTGKVYC